MEAKTSTTENRLINNLLISPKPNTHFFGDAAEHMESQGYPVGPVTAGMKAIFKAGWSVNNVHANAAMRVAWRNDPNNDPCSIGILLGEIVCIDVDCAYEKESQIISDVIDTVLVSLLGKRPKRIGKFPKFSDYFRAKLGLELHDLVFSHPDGRDFTIEMKGAGEMSVVAGPYKLDEDGKPETYYIYPDDDNIFNTHKNELPQLTQNQFETLKVELEAKLATEGWELNRGITPATREDNRNSLIDEAHGLDWTEAKSWLLIEFLLKVIGYNTKPREEWIKILWVTVDRLGYADGALESFIKLCRCDEYPDEAQDIAAQWQAAIRRNENGLASKVRFDFGLQYVYGKKDPEHKKQWAEFKRKKTIEASAARLKFYRKEFEAITPDTIEKINDVVASITMNDNDVLIPNDRAQLAEHYKAAYNQVDGNKLSLPDAKKALAYIPLDAASPAASKVSEPRRIMNKALEIGLPLKDQYGGLYLEFVGSTGRRETMRVLGPEFMTWVMMEAMQHNPNVVANEKMAKDIAIGVSAMLSAIPDIPTYPFYMRNAQVGTGTPSDPYKLYLDLCDDRGRVVEFTAQGWRVIDDMQGLPFRFVKGANSESIDVPYQVQASDLPDRCKQFWKHMPNMDIAQTNVLGAMVNSYFPSNHQPILILYSPPPGQTAKSPSAYRMRQILDPQSTPLGIIPTDIAGFIRTVAGNNVVAMDEVNQLSAPWQKKLASYATGGGEKTRMLYHSTATVDLVMSGLKIFTTNNHSVFTLSEVASRSIQVNVKKFAVGEKIDPVVADDAFITELNDLRATLFALIVEVIRTLPTINDSKGHRFGPLARITNAIHRVTKVDGSMSRTGNLSDRGRVDSLIEDNPYLYEVIVHLIQMHDGSLECSHRMLLNYVTHWRDDVDNELVRRQGGWQNEPGKLPTDAKSATSLLMDNLADTALVGLDITKPAGGKRDKHGTVYVFSINQNAPASNEVGFVYSPPGATADTADAKQLPTPIPQKQPAGEAESDDWDGDWDSWIPD